MWIVTQNNMTLVNANMVTDIGAQPSTTEGLIDIRAYMPYSETESNAGYITIGRYANDRASKIMAEIINAIKRKDKIYRIPDE